MLFFASASGGCGGELFYRCWRNGITAGHLLAWLFSKALAAGELLPGRPWRRRKVFRALFCVCWWVALGLHHLQGLLGFAAFGLQLWLCMGGSLKNTSVNLYTSTMYIQWNLRYNGTLRIKDTFISTDENRRTKNVLLSYANAVQKGGPGHLSIMDRITSQSVCYSEVPLCI